MRLTKQTSYAIRILIHCAAGGEASVKVSDISRMDGITEYNVAKIVPLLVRGGFITTNRGRGGGLKLAKPAAEITLGDVLRVTEATHVEAECAGGSLDCAIKRGAAVNQMFGEALQAFITVLDQHTLAELVKSRAPTTELRLTPTKAQQKPRAVTTAGC